MNKLSVVISAANEEKNLPRAIESVGGLADEIVVVDCESEDRTVEVAKKLGAKVYFHKYMGYVEPVRNYAVSKTKGDWILVLDADEEIPLELKKHLAKMLKDPKGDYYRIPRKNLIFGKWVKHGHWWPDFVYRFFKKGFVSWGDEIHSIPVTKGKGIDIPVKENLAITHHNYDFFDQYLEKLFRYTKVQAGELLKGGYVFDWKDLIKKPLSEFLTKYFEGEGYKDGVHGLIIALLQSFSELVVYIRIWEKQGAKDEELKVGDIKKEISSSIKDINWWIKRKMSWLKFLMLR